MSAVSAMHMRKGWSADRAAYLQRRRVAVNKAAWGRCRANEKWRNCVADLRRLDGLRPEDWLPQASKTGYGAKVADEQCKPGRPTDTPMLVPAEVNDVASHIQMAMELEHPASLKGATFTPGSDFEERREAECESAVRREVHAGWRFPDVVGDAWMYVEAHGEELHQLSRELREEFSPQHILSAPCKDAHAALFAAIVEALDLPDKDILGRLLLGAPVTGVLDPTRSWDWKPPTRPLGLDTHDLKHPAWNEWLAMDIERRAQSEKGRQDAKVVYDKTVSELDKGMCEGPYDEAMLDVMYGVGGWRASRRFWILQGESVRVCDHMAESLTNDGCIDEDKMRCQRPDLPARNARRYARRLPRAEVQLEHGTEDQEAAYRRALTEEPGMCVVAVWDGRQVVYFTLHGYNFGLKSAVIYFNAIGAIASSAARRLLSILSDNYFDDYHVQALKGNVSTSQRVLGLFMQMLGFPFSEAKHVLHAPSNPWLGVVSDLSQVPTTGLVKMHLSEKRRERIVGLCEEALREGLPKHAAASLCGKARWATTWVLGRVGRAALQPIQERASDDSGDDRVTLALKRAIDFTAQVVARAPSREIDVMCERPDHLALIWSDAACKPKDKAAMPPGSPRDERARQRAGEPDAEFDVTGGFVIIILDNDRRPVRILASEHSAPPGLLEKLAPGKKTYIGQGEIMYAVAPYTSAPDVLRDCKVLHFVDNVGALTALIKGYARAMDAGLIVNSFHAMAAGMGVDTYFEYVRSKANVGDFPSRSERGLLRKALVEAGLGWMTVEWIECVLPTFGDWKSAAPEYWLARGSDVTAVSRPVQQEATASVTTAATPARKRSHAQGSARTARHQRQRR